MFKPVRATNIKEYLEQLTPERKTAIEFLHAFIQKTAPSLKPNFLYNMPGYGTFQYKNNKKEIMNWPIIAVASQKNYISVYVCALEKGLYLSETYKEKLGKVSVGKSCIRFKNIANLNLSTFQTVLKLAEKSPGLVSKS